MNGVSSGQLRVAKDDRLGLLDDGQVDRQHLVRQAQQGIEGRLDRLPPVDRPLPVPGLLAHFGVRGQALALRNAGLQQPPRVGLVRVGSPHEVHWDVGVNEDHSGPWLKYPRSISPSMVLTSPLGYE